MASAHLYDVIIIGAGVEGSATGYYLTSRHTKNVLLLEQFEVLHARGSSHGGSRSFHMNYPSAMYIQMIKESLQLWKEIEGKSGTKLYWNCGALGFSAVDDHSDLVERLKFLSDNEVSHKFWSSNEVNHHYFEQLAVPQDHECIYLPDAGSIKASLSVKTMQELFISNGGEVKECHRVTTLVPGQVTVTVETTKGSFEAKTVILTTGAWANELLASTGLHLPMKIYRSDMFYFKVSNPKAFSVEEFPVFFETIFAKFVERELQKVTPSVYGTPALEHPGMIKICQFFGDPEISLDDIQTNKECNDYGSLPAVQAFIKKYLKGVDQDPSIKEHCIYANSPHFHPYIGRHPKYPNIVIAAGFSHGFKMSPVFGKIISELAMDQPPSYDLKYFAIERLEDKEQKK